MLDAEIVERARQELAQDKRFKNKDVPDILEGRWDHTPLFKDAYGKLWRQSKIGGL